MIGLLRHRFSIVADRYLGIMLWGSFARGDQLPGSDIDVAIVAGEDLTPRAALDLAWGKVNLGGFGHRVDLHAFEELPVHLQAGVIREGVVITSPDVPALYEYFRPFRRRWDDQAHRQRLSPEDLRHILHKSGGTETTR